MGTQDQQYGDDKKAIDEWLPITSSRNAKWWYSAFHNVTAMVGAGVLSLPYAMSELGWGPGVAVLVISWVVTLYTLWQMVEMHEMVPGKRFDRYHELGQHAFGKKLGLYIVVPQQLIVEVGVNIVYMVTGGKSLKKFHDLVCDESCKDIKLTYFIMIFASVHFVLSHLPNFNSIAGVSLAAAVMSLSYSTIAWTASLKKGVQPDVQYGYKAKSTTGTVFNFFSALGDVAFAYAGHNVVLEIQATIPSTPEKPSKGPMWKGVIVAYIVVAMCYFPVALIGYWMYGNEVSDNILISLEKPTWLIAMANLFVVVHVIGSYQLPCVMWLSIYKPKKWSLSWITNWIYIVLKSFFDDRITYREVKTNHCASQNLRVFPLSSLAKQDTRTKEQKAIDDWLPITSSRKAKWWYAAFHNVTAMVGAGVLSLPYAMSNLGWGPGVTILILSWVITLYTLWQMVEMHEMIPGKRFDRYHELGQEAFGEKLGLYIVVPQQLICEVGVNVVYMVTGGTSLKKFHETVCEGCVKIKTTYFIMIFASVHFIFYSTIAWTASIHKGMQQNVEYGYKAKTPAQTTYNFLTALGDVAFAYAGHNVVLEIQATIPSTPEKPSKGPMWKGVVVAYIVVALCYFPVALIGYYMFGNQVADNVLISLEKPKWLIAAANMFVVIHVIGSYQIYAMPVFDMLETLLVKKLKFKPSRLLRFVTRNVYICIFLGLCLMILSPIGGLQNIIKQAKEYKFYKD
ncbi:Amino acid transporter, transmembrane [Cynara cardunculus var. scolymus]|uniref:Amino acid transporter, transmembrane n=1 Tax=Cynara cardunculus var. scolymus TaxID=59895 RepID=A0A124SF94_CYNCS|nr:Amino acid transporter, transmembrane [Cynara cardunculus var. scolymus]